MRKKEEDFVLSHQVGKDRIHWAWSAIGDYTVKSGYHLGKEDKRNHQGRNEENGSSSRNEKGVKCWKFQWKLNMKHILKHFIWKCLQNNLPTNEVIKGQV